ncbi:poly-gamma-glutamate synthesis protein (capsule biosynthesis protein) [Kineosphaera limosa]|uniref:Capsule synthesis protein CapA domain-containing protein n=1 Tax=Kineosphaera limosa NBRC 100340 TaxID=1184609 RepID=K6W594_9MICO|nr:CapA family protein [Kineosphaera limosa]NYE02890.1 poly-gamma-glutamate synthesis protein (capsule biosynthesis protein) [Kineosphaera limosa]GAB94320.1 hypothetical protein KILIM_004_01120 [Kineosphaera limosa NBRC 100340]
MTSPRGARRAAAPARRAIVTLLAVVGLLGVIACQRAASPPDRASTVTQAATQREAPPIGHGGQLAVEEAAQAPAYGPTDGPTQGAGAPSPERTPAPAQSVTVVLTGDTLVHPPLWRTAERDASATKRAGELDFRPMLAAMRPLIDGADAAVCHLETPVAEPGGPYRGYPAFSVPPQILDALAWVGYDGCTTASNHSLDAGFAGLIHTIDAMAAAGLGHTGTWATAADAGSPLMIEARGVRIAVITGTYDTNGIPLPRNAPWSVALLDPARLIASAKAARADGADLVLAGLHWGAEYASTPTAAQRRIARTLADSGQIDLIYGHHAHVVQPFDRIGDTWVLYGLGNAVAHHATRAPGVDDGVAARVTFTRARSAPAAPEPGGSKQRRWSTERVEYVPTTVLRSTGERPARIVPLEVAAADRGVSAAERARLERARDAVSGTVRSLRAPGIERAQASVPTR